MIYTVTVNPSIDYIVKVEDLKLGDLNRMKADYKLPGGKGINVSRVLKQLQVENTATGFLGGFTGDFINNQLLKEGIHTHFTAIEDDTRINIKLKHGEETEINGLGPAITEAEKAKFFEWLQVIQAEDIIILSGSVPPALGNHFYEEVITRCNEKNAEFMIDTTGQELLAALEHQPILVKPNHHELAELFETTFTKNEEIIPYGQKLLALGAKHVIVSMAGDGALLFVDDQVYFAEALKGKLENSVGAGDSMVAGFLGEFDRHHDAVEAFKVGVATGGATAFSTDLAKASLIQKLLPQVKISKLTTEGN